MINEVLKEQFIEFMEKYNLKKLDLYSADNMSFVGTLSKELKYERGYCYYLNLCGDELINECLRYAVRIMNLAEEVFENLHTETEIEIAFYDREDEFTSRSTLKRTEKRKGTLDSIFEYYDRENNRLRYCNGTYYKFVNSHYSQLFRVWHDLNDSVRNFNNYYLGSFVD